MLDAQRLQRRSDNFGLSLNALTPARIALASEAFNLVDPLGLDLLSVVRDGLFVYKKQRTASIPVPRTVQSLSGFQTSRSGIPEGALNGSAIDIRNCTSVWYATSPRAILNGCLSHSQSVRVSRSCATGERSLISGKTRIPLRAGGNPINAMHFVCAPAKRS